MSFKWSLYKSLAFNGLNDSHVGTAVLANAEAPSLRLFSHNGYVIKNERQKKKNEKLKVVCSKLSRLICFEWMESLFSFKAEEEILTFMNNSVWSWLFLLLISFIEAIQCHQWFATQINSVRFTSPIQIRHKTRVETQSRPPQ